MPVLDSIFSIGIEVLFLLIDKSLSLESISLVVLEISDSILVLDITLLLLEVREFVSALSFFFTLLLFSHLQLFVSDSPEFGEIFLLLRQSGLLSLLSLNLELATSLDGSLHFSFSQLLLFEKPVSTVFSLSYLPIKNLLLVILQLTKLLDLSINHALASGLLAGEAGLFAFFLHVLEKFALLSELLNLFLLFDLLETLSFLNSHELLVSLREVSTHLSDLLLACNFTLLLSFQILFSLALDELTLKHLFLELLDIA